jgi:peroxiredoxin Q/BCP
MTKRLIPGEKAPNFTATDVTGKKINLSAYKDTYVLLVFLRYAGCPFCNLAIHRLAVEHKQLLDNDCEIIAFIQSSKENIETNIYKRHALTPQFPIIADKEMEIYKKYVVTKTSIVSYAASITKIPYWVYAVKDHGFKQSKVDGKLFLVPAYFLVNGRTGTLVRTDYATSFYEHRTFTEIYQPLLFEKIDAVYGMIK